MEYKKTLPYNCREEWLNKFKWLSADDDDTTRVYCKVCSRHLKIGYNGIHTITTHQSSNKHQTNFMKSPFFNEEYQMLESPLPPNTSTSNCSTLDIRKSNQPALEYNQTTQFPLQSSFPPTTAIADGTTQDIRKQNLPALAYNQISHFPSQTLSPSSTATLNYITHDMKNSNRQELQCNQTTQFQLQSSPSTVTTLEDTTQYITKPNLPALEYSQITQCPLQTSSPSNTTTLNYTMQDMRKSNRPVLQCNHQSTQCPLQSSSPLTTTTLDDTTQDMRKSNPPVLQCNQSTQCSLQSSSPLTTSSQTTQCPLQTSSPSNTTTLNYTTQDMRKSNRPVLQCNHQSTQCPLQSSSPLTTTTLDDTTQDTRESNLPVLQCNKATQFLLQTFSSLTSATLDATTKPTILRFEFPYDSSSSIRTTLCETEQVKSIESSEKNQKLELSEKSLYDCNVAASEKMDTTKNIHEECIIKEEYPDTHLNDTAREMTLHQEKENLSLKNPFERENSIAHDFNIKITNVCSKHSKEKITGEISNVLPKDNSENSSREKNENSIILTFQNFENYIGDNAPLLTEKPSEDKSLQIQDEQIQVSPYYNPDAIPKEITAAAKIGLHDNRDKSTKMLVKRKESNEDQNTMSNIITSDPKTETINQKNQRANNSDSDIHSNAELIAAKVLTEGDCQNISEKNNKASNYQVINSSVATYDPYEFLSSEDSSGKFSENAHSEESLSSVTKIIQLCENQRLLETNPLGDSLEKSNGANNNILSNCPKSYLKVKNSSKFTVNRKIKPIENSDRNKSQTKSVNWRVNLLKRLQKKQNKTVISHEGQTTDLLNADLSKCKSNTSDDIQLPDPEVSSDVFQIQNISVQEVSNSIQQNTQSIEADPENAVLISSLETKRSDNHSKNALNMIVQEPSKYEPQSIKCVAENLNQLEHNSLSGQLSNDLSATGHKSHQRTKENCYKNSKANALAEQYVPIQEVSGENYYFEHLSGLGGCFMTSTHSQINASLIKKDFPESFRNSNTKTYALKSVAKSKNLGKTIIRKYKRLRTRPLKDSHKKINRKKFFCKSNTNSSVNLCRTKSNISTHSSDVSKKNHDHFIKSGTSSENVSAIVEHNSSNDAIEGTCLMLTSETSSGSECFSEGPHSSTSLQNNLQTTERKTCDLRSSFKLGDFSRSHSPIISNSPASSRFFGSQRRTVVKTERENCIPSCSKESDGDSNVVDGILPSLPLPLSEDSNSSSTNDHPLPLDRSVFNLSNLKQKVTNVSQRMLKRKRIFEIECAKDLSELRTLLKQVKFCEGNEFAFLDSIYCNYVSSESQNELNVIKLLMALRGNNYDFPKSNNSLSDENVSRDEPSQIKKRRSSAPNCVIEHHNADHSNPIRCDSSVKLVKHKNAVQKNCKKRHVKPTTKKKKAPN